MLRRILLLIIFTPIFTGCETLNEFSNRNWMQQFTKPTPWGNGNEIPEGSEMFRAGWKDGCESGYSAYGNTRYMAGYGFEQDPEKAKNPEYYRAWKDAFVYCRWYVYNWSKPWHQ